MSEFGVRRRVPVLALLAALLPSAGMAGDLEFEPFAIKNKNKGFELKLAGYGQFDLRSFNWDVQDPAFRLDDADVRRTRVGLELEWRKLHVDFDLDLTNAARKLANQDQSADAGAEVKNAYVQYQFAKAFALRAGAFKPPVGHEFLTSAGRTDFVERAMLSNSLGPDRDWGVMALGEPGKRVSYQVGVFGGDGRTSDQSAGTTFAARLGFAPWKPLDVQASFSRGTVRAEPEGQGADPSPKGFLGRSPSGWRFYERKFVDGARTRWGADAQYTRGPFQLKGEFLQGREERRGQGSTFQDLPVEVGNGWSATASYVLTGEKKQRSLKPKRPLTKGGPGLIEVAAKYEGIRIDDTDNTGFEGAGNRARNIRRAGNDVLWGGVLWLPLGWVRLYGDVYSEKYLDPLLAPEPPGAAFVSGAPIGRGRYTTFVARIELLFP